MSSLDGKLTNLFHICAPLSLLALSGCCRPYYPSTPVRPAQVAGWNHRDFGTVRTITSLVLKKGESSEQRNLGVTFVDFEPAKICTGLAPEPSAAKIVLRFYRPSDKHTFCDTTIWLPNGATSGGGNLDCANKDDVPPSFGLRSFNPVEQWIWLELTVTKGDVRW